MRWSVIACLVAVCGCGRVSYVAQDVGSADGGRMDVGTDTGTSVDTGLVIDTGPVIDTGLVIDTGPVIDTGLVTDTGPVIDTGLVTDTGTSPDSGSDAATGCAHVETAGEVARFPAHPALGTGPFTFEAWVRTTDASAVMVVLANRDSTPTGYLFGLYGGVPFVQLSDTPNVRAIRNVADGAWHHVAITRSATDALSCYVDFLPVVLDSATSARDLVMHPEVVIGADSATPTDSLFVGGLWMARVWRVARTATELEASAYGSVGTPSSLYFEVRLDDASEGMVTATVFDLPGPADLGAPTGPTVTSVAGCPRP